MAGPLYHYQYHVAHSLALRQDDDGTSPTDQFLRLISNPFKEQIQLNAFWVSLATSLGVSALLALLFSIFRPYHNAIYAPRVKHADKNHAPPPVGKGVFAWVRPVLTVHAEHVADRIGLDAIVFLCTAKMLRNIYLSLALIGCGILIAVNITQSNRSGSQTTSAFTLMTPLYIKTNAVWAQVVCAYAFDFVIIFFLWKNYRHILALRRRYFESPEYQMSLHARTLMITNVPQNLRSEEGLMRLTDGINPTSSLPRTTIGRNVKDLPSLIKKHEEAVRELESVLAKYFKNPDRLPVNRPTMRTSKKLGGRSASGKVDAIDYLTECIRELEARIRDVRQSVDKRNPMPYGFASWEAIEHAHAVAYAARNKKPQGTFIRLAPRPHDIIWENLHLSPQTRRWRRLVNVFWVTLLTVLWIAPNAMIAIFLSDLNNLGLVWPAFQTSLEQNPNTWAAVQGIAAPALTSLIYLILPIFFRRLMRRAGDITKTAREKHVIHYLYFFFVFNNLIVFSLFSAAWTYVAAVINARNNNESAWQAIKDGQFWYKSMSAMCQVSPFWVTWLLQRNLGATLDLVQLFSIVWKWFMKTFMSPTPRQSIEWSAPPPFEYASYYNYYLFYATVALCFATLQPIILPVAALYFAFDCLFKRYLLLYVFVTKNESGGVFWPVVVNRVLFASLLSNIVIALVAKSSGTWTMIYCMVPLPFILLGFKWYCSRTFDNEMIYYNKGTLNDPEAFGTSMGKGPKRAGDRLNSRFGHPALFKTLMTPMVHARAADLLKTVYQGRLDNIENDGGYSDIALQSMSNSAPGKSMESAPFEVVAENQLDFSYYKNRADFRDEFGGGIYGRPEDHVSEYSHTPRPFASDSPASSRASSPAPYMTVKQTEGYDLGLMRPGDVGPPAFRSPMSRVGSNNYDPNQSSPYLQGGDESESGLLSHAQPPAVAEGDNFHTMDRWRGRGYGPVAQDDNNPNPTSYDYFRGAR